MKLSAEEQAGLEAAIKKVIENIRRQFDEGAECVEIYNDGRLIALVYEDGRVERVQ